MLRSLVGSEMCIRDRAKKHHARHLLGQRAQLGFALKQGLFGDAAGGDVFCLLYTSDAADDLLCVDLGGRRIIKKKNMLTVYIPTAYTV